MTFSFEKYMDLFSDNNRTDKQSCYNWFIVVFFFYHDNYCDNIFYGI